MPEPAQSQADRQLLALAAAYQARTLLLRNNLERFVRGTWRALGVYRQQQQAAYVREILPTVLGGQQQLSSMTATFLAHQRDFATGSGFKPAPPRLSEVTGSAARLGTTPAEVHGRPFHLVWRQLDELPRVQGSIEKAIQAGEDRAVSLALDDLQLAKNHTAAQVGARDDRVKYVERLLEGPSSCGLCVVASTQRYNPGVLLPIHGGCDCSQVFRYADTDPGQILNLERLQDVQDLIEQRFGASDAGARNIPGTADNHGVALAYRDVLVTHEHGELGPVLGVRGESFVGPTDLAA